MKNQNFRDRVRVLMPLQHTPTQVGVVVPPSPSPGSLSMKNSKLVDLF